MGYSLDMNDFSCFVTLQESPLLHIQQSHALLIFYLEQNKASKKADRNTDISFPLIKWPPNLRLLHGARDPAVPLSDENVT